jgi:tripartite-type tricarboxylate transporter receptor subunit TctC
MKAMFRAAAALVLACAGLLVATPAAVAADYPNKPVRMVVTFPPGGSADYVARMLANKMQQSLGQPFIIDNKPGATGNIGIEQTMRSPADGYTIVFATSAVTISPWLQKTPFDITKDLAPISQPNLTPYVVVVNASLPYKTLRELLDAAKKSPGKINYGSYGVGSPTHLAMAWLASEAGIAMNHVPYKGSAPMLTDLVGGQIEAGFDLPSNVLPHVRSGKLRVLAVGSTRPTATFPEAQTIASLYPGYDSDGWQGLWAPAGTPRDIVDTLQREVVKALADPEVRAHLLELGFEPLGSSPDAFAAQVRNDLAKWGKLIKDNNIKPES